MATPVPQLVFGNNINAEHLSPAYDAARGGFEEGFLSRVRAMGITFLRYPGGCNADVFDWRHTVGPIAERQQIINYHNGSARGIATFGVGAWGAKNAGIFAAQIIAGGDPAIRKAVEQFREEQASKVPERP